MGSEIQELIDNGKRIVLYRHPKTNVEYKIEISIASDMEIRKINEWLGPTSSKTCPKCGHKF